MYRFSNSLCTRSQRILLQLWAEHKKLSLLNFSLCWGHLINLFDASKLFFAVHNDQSHVDPKEGQLAESWNSAEYKSGENKRKGFNF